CQFLYLLRKQFIYIRCNSFFIQINHPMMFVFGEEFMRVCTVKYTDIKITYSYHINSIWIKTAVVLFNIQLEFNTCVRYLFHEGRFACTCTTFDKGYV